MTAILLRLWPYIAIAALSAGLYWQIGRTAAKQSEIDNLLTVNQSQLATIERQQREAALSEVVLVNNAAKRETITETRDVIKYRIREVIKDAPASDCINQPVPANVICLLNGTCADSNSQDLSAHVIDP